jgi:hypothetical protein
MNIYPRVKLAYIYSHSFISTRVKAHRFHQTCDAVVKTVVLVRVKESNFIFGGFTGNAAWKSSDGWEYVRASNSFLFSLVNAVGAPVRLVCTEPLTAICCHSDNGPLFGECGNDISIRGDWTRAGMCWCSPASYKACDPAFAVTPVNDSLLAGSLNNWAVDDLEVFALEASG